MVWKNKSRQKVDGGHAMITLTADTSFRIQISVFDLVWKQNALVKVR